MLPRGENHHPGNPSRERSENRPDYAIQCRKNNTPKGPSVLSHLLRNEMLVFPRKLKVSAIKADG